MHPHALLPTCSCVCQQTSGGGRSVEYKQLSAASVKQPAGPWRAPAPPEGLEGKRSGTSEALPHTPTGVLGISSRCPGHLSHETVLRFPSGKQTKQVHDPITLICCEYVVSKGLLLLRSSEMLQVCCTRGVIDTSRRSPAGGSCEGVVFKPKHDG